MCMYIAIRIMSLESGGNGKDEKEGTSNIKMVSLININVFSYRYRISPDSEISGKISRQNHETRSFPPMLFCAWLGENACRVMKEERERGW